MGAGAVGGGVEGSLAELEEEPVRSTRAVFLSPFRMSDRACLRSSDVLL